MFVNQNPFSDVLYFYQKKIGHLDQQQWEKSVEERVLNGINLSVTKKVNKLKNSLIDLDYIRGSAFNKNKPKHSWLSVTFYGIVRAVCFPFYWNWWIDQTNRRICCVLLTLYLLQLCSMFIYFNDDQFNDKKFSQAIPPSEVITPLFMFFFLSILYSQIFASSSNHFSNRGKSYLKPNALNNLEEKLEEQKPTSKEQTLFDLDDQYSDKTGKQAANCKRTGNSNAKFGKLSNKNGRLKFKTCPARTRSTLRTSKCDQTRRKRHLTGDASSASLQISAYQEEQQRLVLHNSDNNLPEKKALGDDLKELLNANPNDNSNENSTENLNDRLEPELKKLSANLSNQEEEENLQSDLHNLQIKCESNYLDLTTSEDCSPYSSISSSANLKLLLKQKDGDKVENACKDEADDYSSKQKQNYFEQRIYQPQKTRYYYFKEVVNESNSQTGGYPTFAEEQANFQRKATDANEDSNDSENGSISPTTPMKSLNDWPMINSENSTEDDEEEEEEVLINVEEEQKALPVKQSSDSNDNCPDNKRLNSLTSKNPSLFPDDSIDKISCTIFQDKEWQKIDLSMIDISSMIIKKVDTTRYSNEYFYFAILFSLLFAFIPQIFRFQQLCTNLNSTEFLQSNVVSLSNLAIDNALVNCDQNELNILDAYGLRKNESNECRILKSNENQKPSKFNKSAFVCGAINASNSSEEFIEYLNYLPIVIFDLLVDVFKNSIYSFQMKFIVFVSLFERFTLSLLFFILLCVAERTYRERFLYAKYFCHLTSARRAKRNELPHFRLNKVQNIKSWLSIRSFLKKHGPQRSVDSIVSTSFILAVSLLTFLCIQLLRENDIFSESLCCYEMVVWVLTCGIFIMRLLLLGSKMNRKYKSNLSVLLTEQINLYLQLEQKPHKKEQLQLANNVLKLAADLLKQLEVPFKISGFSANPYLYNVVKVIVLSAFSAVLSEMFGFKLKLYKIKISA